MLKIVLFSEPFLEATPQTHITMILMGMNTMDLFSSSKHYALVMTSFVISVMSATFGIAKLLKNGPIKMVRKEGKIGGYGTPGFILLMVVVAGNMIGKATWMGICFRFSRTNEDEAINLVSIWALTCILPQLLLVK